MIWTHPDIDHTGTMRDLDLAPLAARHLGKAAARITDPGTRVFLVTTMLSHCPHHIRSAPDRPESGYRLEGGRALRAAVMVRALESMEGDVDPTIQERLLAAAMLGNLVMTGMISDVPVRRAWLERLAVDESRHLAAWGLAHTRALDLIDLAVTAADLHSDASGTRAPITLPECRMIRACRAAALARPLNPGVIGAPAPLPAWMDPDMPMPEASRLIQADHWHDFTRGLEGLASGCRPGRRYRAFAEGFARPLARPISI